MSLKIISYRVKQIKKLEENRFLFHLYSENNKVAIKEIECSTIINCTGFQPLNGNTSSKLIRSIIDRDLIHINDSKKGFELDSHFQSTQTKGLYVMGPLVAGHFNENLKLWHTESNSRILALSKQLVSNLLKNMEYAIS